MFSAMAAETIGLLVECRDEPGVLHRITDVILRHNANIGYVAGGARRDADFADLQLEVSGAQDEGRLIADLEALAGALMGGDITNAVREIREAGILVLCTNMAGSVPDAADVVVSDPVEAGVMAVMLIADTAKFSIDHVRGKRF